MAPTLDRLAVELEGQLKAMKIGIVHEEPAGAGGLLKTALLRKAGR